MAKIRQRELFWDAPPDTDVVGYAIYAGQASQDNFLALVDTRPVDGGVAPVATGTETRWPITGLADGTWQFAVTAVDQAQNESDPYQHPAWRSVPLDLTPPSPPSGGGLNVI